MLNFFLKIFFLFIINLIIFTQEIEIIGKSVKGLPIKVYKFGEGKELIIILAGIYGNEKKSVKKAYDIINLLQQGKIELSNEKMICIIPLINPDGFKENKKTNANNVDLNRNFYTKSWKNKFVFINEVISAGEFPFSEPETIALKAFFQSLNKNIVSVIISLNLQTDGIFLTTTNYYYNIQLLDILKNELKNKNICIDYFSCVDLTEWASSELGIASVIIKFKEEQIDEIVKLIEVLNKINFKDKIYTKEFFNFLNVDNNVDNKENSILKLLPEKVLTKIRKTKNGEELFLKYFKKIGKENELLLLVNKKNKLDKNYLPPDLLNLTNKDLPSTKTNFQLRKIILEDLKIMIEDAQKYDVSLIIISAYRSYQNQEDIYKYWIKKLGKNKASMLSAVPGASQHQLGTTIDFNSLNLSFENTKEGKWLRENAYKYGFIMSYPQHMEKITGYEYEPWHYRYVGKEAAYIIYNFFDNSLELFLQWYWSLHKYL